MKVFRFSLESALQRCHWKETEAKRLLGLEVKKHGDIEYVIKEARENIRQTQEQRFQEKNWMPETQIQYIEYGKILLARVEEQQRFLLRQKIVLQKRQRELNAVIMDRKKLEKLREREFERYRVVARRKELSGSNEVAANFVRLRAG